MESIQSVLSSYTAKHFYSLQEEWAAAIKKAEYKDEALLRSLWPGYSQVPTKDTPRYRKETRNNRFYFGRGWVGEEPWLFFTLEYPWKSTVNERNY